MEYTERPSSLPSEHKASMESTKTNTSSSQEKPRELSLPVVALLMTGLVAGAVLAIFFVHHVDAVPETSHTYYCGSPPCKVFAYEVSKLRQGNQKTSPCDSFYRHACQNWRETKAPLHLAKGHSYDDHVRYRILQELVDSFSQWKNSGKSGHLFQSATYEIFSRCVRKRGDSGSNGELSEALSELGLQFPTLPGAQPPTTLSMAAGRMARHTGLMPLIRVQLLLDRGRTGPGVQLLLTVGDDLADPERVRADTGARTFSLMNTMNHRFKDRADADNIWRIERNRRLLLIMSQDDTAIYEQMTVQYLETKFSSPVIQWSFKEYLHTIFDRAVSNNTVVLIKNVAYVTELPKFLAQDRALFLSSYANYVCLHLVLHYAPYLHDAQAQYFMSLTKDGWSALPDNSLLCARMAEAAVPLGAHLVLAHKTVARLELADLSSLMTYMLRNIKDLTNALDLVYAMSSYASERSRVKMFHKLQHLQVYTFLENDTTLFEEAIGVGLNQILSESAIKSAIELNSRLWSTHWNALGSGRIRFLKLGYLPSVLDLYSTYVPEFNALFVSLGAFASGLMVGDDKFEVDKVAMGYRILHGLTGILLDEADMWSSFGDLDDAQDFYAAAKTANVRRCLNRTLHGGFHDDHDDRPRADFGLDRDFRSLAAITPLYRFFRKRIKHRAYPLPEYRMQFLAELTEGEMFYYMLGKSLCSKGDKAVTATHDMATEKLVNAALTSSGSMFTTAFKCKLITDCNLFPTTRHSYL